MIDVTVIIVTYNTQAQTLACLESVHQQWLKTTQLKLEIFLVDNASQDTTCAEVAKLFPRVKIIKSPINVGFAAANNLAIAASTSRFVLLLNSDTELPSNHQLDQMIRWADTQPQAGMVTPKVVLRDGQLDPACHRGEPTLWASLCYFLGLEKLFPQSKLFGGYHLGFANMRQPHQIDAATGAALLVKRVVIDAIGPLDERFFMYAEDLDWCRRCREAGYEVWFWPNAIVRHLKYQSGMAAADTVRARQTTQHFYDTMLQYFDKHEAKKYPGFVRWLVKTAITIKKGAV